MAADPAPVEGEERVYILSNHHLKDQIRQELFAPPHARVVAKLRVSGKKKKVEIVDDILEK